MISPEHAITSASSTSDDVIAEVLGSFAAAWRVKDLDQLMSFMTDDCEFRASVGLEPGTSYVGSVAVRRGFEQSLAHDDGADVRVEDILIAGNRALVQWKYVYEGRDREVRGCDVFTLEGACIRVKDAYRKTPGDITRHALHQEIEP